MNIIKKITVYFLCSFMLISANYFANADNSTRQELLESLSTQEQFDVLYFYISYLKINTKEFEHFNTDIFQREPLNTMTQWREALFTYIANIPPTQRPVFFCCVYYHIHPGSNIMQCAPPSTITDFRMNLVRNLINSGDTPELISIHLTYGRIKTVRIIL